MKSNRRYANPKLMLVVVLSLCAALLLSGCRGANSGSKRLSLAVVSGVEGEALKQAARDYEVLAGVRVDIAEFPYDNLFEKESIDLTAATGAYDLIMMDDPWFPRFASNQLLADLTPLFQKLGQTGPDDDFISSSIALCKHPYETGATFALPYVGNSQLFFYRKDLFEKYNLKEPASWDDVLTAAKTIDEREQTGSPSGGRVHGYVMRAGRGNSAVADFMPIFWSFGAEMFGEDHLRGFPQPAVNSKEGIDALKFMLELGKYTPNGYASFNASEVSAHLLQGTAAMSINWPVWISAFSDPEKSRVAGKMNFAVMPGARAEGRAEIGNWLIAIPRACRNADAAFDFLLWATAADQMKKSALSGNPPTRRSVFTDSELLAKFPSYPAQLRSLDRSRPRPRTPQWNEIENVFGIFISRANSGELTAEEAMNQANTEIAKIVDRNSK